MCIYLKQTNVNTNDCTMVVYLHNTLVAMQEVAGSIPKVMHSQHFTFSSMQTRFDAVHTLQKLSLLCMNRYERMGDPLVPC